MRRMPWVTRAVYLAAALLLIVPSARAEQSWPTELDAVRTQLLSDNPQERYAARDALTRTLGQLAEPRRAELIAQLIEEFRKYDYRIQLAVAIALSKQPKPWTSTDVNKQVHTLYMAFVETKEETLNRAIDDAMANAAGYYRDAIIDYNQDRIADVNHVVEKFKRTPDLLPKSRYVPNSIFYRAQYLTKAYLLGNPRGQPLIRDAISVLEEFSRSHEKGSSTFRDDALYYLALNHVLLGDRDKAIATLRDLEGKSSANDRVYVYQFFFSKKGRAVDRSFVAPALARKTREYLQEFGTISATEQDPFIDYILKGA